jgi:hypothetical protein
MSDAPSPAFKPREHDASEFEPLPFYGWLERPPDLPVDPEEAATAIYLAHGDVSAAAALLKVSPARLNRVVRGSPRLVRLKAELQRHRSAVSAGS